MKKILLVAVLIAALGLTSCGSFEWEECVNALDSVGYVIMQDLHDPEKLVSTTNAFNNDVLYNGGDFKVKVTKYTHLIKGTDYSRNCQLIEFATKDQAKSYAEFYVETRAPLNTFKVGRQGNVVVLTNMSDAMEIAGLEFN